jgi:hypothetical protein
MTIVVAASRNHVVKENRGKYFIISISLRNYIFEALIEGNSSVGRSVSNLAVHKRPRRFLCRVCDQRKQTDIRDHLDPFLIHFFLGAVCKRKTFSLSRDITGSIAVRSDDLRANRQPWPNLCRNFINLTILIPA